MNKKVILLINTVLILSATWYYRDSGGGATAWVITAGAVANAYLITKENRQDIFNTWAAYTLNAVIVYMGWDIFHEDLYWWQSRGKLGVLVASIGLLNMLYTKLRR